MAEELDRRPKQRKAYASNANPSLEHRSDEDFMAHLVRKKGRPPKDTSSTMNSASIAGSPLTVSGNSSSSKTVAAILKQAKDHQPPKEVIRGQHQSQGQRKKSKQMPEQSQQPSTLLNQLVKGTNSPMGRVGSPSLAVSPAMSPSSIRGVSPLGKDHNHPVTTKSSSLSRDLSPSRITAQMVKVMAETAPTTNAPNLLRSALQGNMPDPMGILSTSKTEGGIVSVVTCTGGPLTNFNPSRKSALNVSNFTQSTNSGSSHQGHTFSKILTNMAGVGGYLGQQSLDSGESKLSGSPISISTVENLLASSDGTIQTVNVSHIPKVTNPGSTNIGTMSAAATSSASPRPSPRSAMEVAQQIKMEANGQKSSAQLAALRPGMQQQLRTQIQSSRSIDAQLAPKQIQVVTSKSQPSTNRSSPKDTDKKQAMDVNMPLLAAKLAPSAVPSVVKVSPSVPNQLKQQQHADLVSSLSVASVQSTISPSLFISSVAKKPSQFSSVNTSPSDLKPRFHLQQHSQTQPGLIFNQSKPVLGETNSLSDHSWLLQQSQHQVISTDHSTPGLNLSGGLGEILSGLEKQQSLERLIQASISGSMGVQNDSSSHVQSIAKQLSSHQSPLRVSSSAQSTVAQPSSASKITQEFVNQATLGGGGLKISSSPLGTVTNTIPTTITTQTISKYRLGDSKQTAIDVDMDIGHLQSITGDGATVKAEASSNISNKDVRRNIHSAISHHLLNTALSSAPNATLAFSTTKPRDSQTPVKSSASLTFHTLQTTSSLAHIPKPIMHASPSVSSLSSVPTTTALPPPPDYTPPPPYPMKFGQFQQGQTQQQNTHNKTGQASKQSVQNPFTFPTTGIKLTPEPEPQGLVSFSVANQHIIIGSNTEHKSSLHQEPLSRFREPKAANVAVGKSDGLNSKHKGATVDMYSLNTEVKTEMNKSFCNHVGEVKEEKKKFQPFNQRISNLSCFPVMNSSYRAAYRSHAVAVQRARAGVITNTAKSLDVLRQNLQRNINKELTEIIKRYTEKYFQPALENIKHNNNEPFLGEDHINYVCRQILEEAKSEYICESGRRSITPSDIPDNISESGSLGSRRMFMKRSRISDSDSEKGSDSGGFKRKTIKVFLFGNILLYFNRRVTPNKPYKTGEPIKREGPKWDPERMKPETLFVMGARANKALGLGNTRGRLYIRHPDIFKYIGDQEDKVWLYEHNLMPATGGKAYMLLLEDIEDLSRSDDYKDSPGLLMHECVGFTVPEWMLVKMKEQMNALRSDSNKRSLSRSPVSDIGESRPKILPFSAFSEANIKEETMVSPADTEDMDFLSTADNDDTQPSSAVSPFTVTGGFDDGGSPSPSDLDPIEDPTQVPSMFA
ncbi:unnamed protein product [Lymnaea stagnalis]|uniref:DNTTIP1 dimerisation domain-containing protein n=1 Tax=Lymnaea stagnalis TaxID=6523 RepID=A0AAV2HQU0_LYMST